MDKPSPDEWRHKKAGWRRQDRPAEHKRDDWEPLFAAATIKEAIERVEEKAKEHPEKFGGRKPYTEIFSELKEVFDQ